MLTSRQFSPNANVDVPRRDLFLTRFDGKVVLRVIVANAENTPRRDARAESDDKWIDE